MSKKQHFSYYIKETENDYKQATYIKNVLGFHEWKEVKSQPKNPVEYSNKNSLSIIKSYFDPLNTYVFNKGHFSHHFRGYKFISKHFYIRSKSDLIKIPQYASYDKTWFIKPVSLLIGSGHGISVVRVKKGEEFLPLVEKYINFDLSKEWIVQEEVEPVMLSSTGQKYDFRVHGVVVFDESNLYVYLANKTLIRKSIEKYNIDNLNRNNLLTNISNARELNLNINDYIMYIDIDNKILFRDIIATVSEIFYVLSEQKKLVNKNKDIGFIIIGIDIILDDNNKLYVIEINQHPKIDFPKIRDYGEFFDSFYDMIFAPLVVKEKTFPEKSGIFEQIFHTKY